MKGIYVNNLGEIALKMCVSYRKNRNSRLFWSKRIFL